MEVKNFAALRADSPTPLRAAPGAYDAYTTIHISHTTQVSAA